MKTKKIMFLLCLICMYFTVIASLFFFWWQNERKDNAELGYSLVMTIDATLNRNASIALMTSKYIDSDCTPDIVRHLSRFAASNPSLRAVNIIKNNNWLCSSVDENELNNLKVEKNNPNLQISLFNRDGVDLYMIFYPFINGKVAIALYKSSLDKMLDSYAKKMNVDIKASINPLHGDGVIASNEYPFWLRINSKKNVADFILEQSIPLVLTTLLFIGFYFARERYRQYTPVLALKNAIKNKEMIPFYQPIIDMKTGIVIGAEVLVRWVHPQQGMIGPNEFIPAVETHDLTTELTTTLMDSVRDDMVRLRGEYINDFHIAINVSPASLKKSDFIKRCLDFSIENHSLHISTNIEITEREQNEVSPEVFKRLIENGVDISLDDFGTGYSNYESISRVKPSFLKIDRMFVDGIGTNSINESILKHIVSFSQEAGIPNVAEGIETEEQHAELKSMGVQFAQGYFYGKPVPFYEFIMNLKDQVYSTH